MSTFTQVLYQIIFRSKDKKPFLDSNNENQLFAYIAVVLKNKQCHSYIVGGANEHIHIVTHIHPTLAPAFLIKDIKLASHKMMQDHRDKFPRFNGWQTGYGLFTYHISAKENLIRYVLNQKIHHQKVTFSEEFESLLIEHGVDYKDEYLP
jgi:putative transposase